MTLRDLTARVRRLDELSRGLAKEVVLWKECNDPLLCLERRAYLGAIPHAVAGVEAARVVLAKARQRLEGERGLWGVQASGPWGTLLARENTPRSCSRLSKRGAAGVKATAIDPGRLLTA
jgi:hypothetical protein